MTKEQQKDKIIEIVKEILDSYSSFTESDSCIEVEMDADDIDFATDEIAKRICREIFFEDTQTAYAEGYDKGCRSKMAYDYVKCAKKYAVNDFAAKLKEVIHERDYIQGYAEIGLIEEIDELLKEYKE